MFLIIACTHGALVLVIVDNTAAPEIDRTTGSFVLDLAMVPTTLSKAQENLPPGPASADFAASEAISPSTEREKPPPEREIPPLPDFAAAPSDLVLPKVVEQTEQVPPVETERTERPAEAQDASAAALAAGPPVLDTAPISERSGAPETGVSENDRKAHAAWQGALSAHLARHTRFPPGFINVGRDRQALVRFVLDLKGVVLTVSLLQSTGSDILDAEALSAVRRASPLPAPTTKLLPEELEFVVPIRFRAQR